MNSSKTMSSVMKKTTSSMMVKMIVTAAVAVRAELLEVERFQIAPPMTPWS